jgi:hypothetical protein
VDELLSHLVRPRIQLEHRNALGERINGHPKPEHLRVAAQECSQFIQVQDLQMQKERFYNVWACASARSSHLMMVACRIPKNSSAADRSSPSASALSSRAAQEQAMVPH